MFELLGIPPQALFGQLLLGLINGAFYAMLSLGLAVIFGMLNVINFTHGAQYMMGAFAAWLLLGYLDVPFWASLVLAPVIVGLIGIVLEKLLLKRIYHLDHLYGFLLTFGMALVIEGLFQLQWGSSGAPYPNPDPGRLQSRLHVPADLSRLCRPGGARDLPRHLVRHRTHQARRLPAGGHRESDPGARLRHQRAAPDHSDLWSGCSARRALAGVLAAPIQQVSALMGTNLVLVVFAVVVIGGMGSIMGSIVTGFGLGMIEGLTKVFYPPASNTVIFVVMAIVLLVKPAGLFGQTK